MKHLYKERQIFSACQKNYVIFRLTVSYFFHNDVPPSLMEEAGGGENDKTIAPKARFRRK